MKKIVVKRIVVPVLAAFVCLVLLSQWIKSSPMMNSSPPQQIRRMYLRSSDDLREILHNRQIDKQLPKDIDQLNALADHWVTISPQTPREAWMAFNVFIRAKRHDDACRIIPLLLEIVRSTDDSIVKRSEICSRMFESFRGLKNEHVEEIKAACEAFAPYYCPYTQVEWNTLWHSPKYGGREKMRTWFFERFQDAQAYRMQQTSASAAVGHWYNQFFQTLDKPDLILAEWERVHQEARDDPMNFQKRSLLFYALERPNSGYRNIVLDLPNLDWLLEIVDQLSAIESRNTAKALARVKGVPTGIVEAFLRRAITEPLSQVELSDMGGIRIVGGMMMDGMGNVWQLTSDEIALITETRQAIFRVEAMDSLLAVLRSRECEEESIHSLQQSKEALQDKYHIVLVSGTVAAPYYTVLDYTVRDYMQTESRRK